MKQATFSVTLLCALLCGCVGVIPMPKRTVTQQGRTPTVDVHFIAPGHTTKSELREKLKATDSGFESDEFFVGRWRSSKWGGWIAIGTQTGGGGVAGERLWGNTNLIVKFDESGVVENYDVCPDGALISKLTPVARTQKVPPSQTLDTAILFGGHEIPIKLGLSEQAVEVEELMRLYKFKHRPQYHYTVPVQQFRGVTLGRNQDDIGFVETTLRFAGDLRQFHGPRGKNVSLQLTVTQLVAVLAYASEHSLGSASPR